MEADADRDAAALVDRFRAACAAMLRSAAAIVRFYQELAGPLAREHGLGYPTGHERLMLARLSRLG